MHRIKPLDSYKPLPASFHGSTRYHGILGMQAKSFKQHTPHEAIAWVQERANALLYQGVHIIDLLKKEDRQIELARMAIIKNPFLITTLYRHIDLVAEISMRDIVELTYLALDLEPTLAQAINLKKWGMEEKLWQYYQAEKQRLTKDSPFDHPIKFIYPYPASVIEQGALEEGIDVIYPIVYFHIEYLDKDADIAILLDDWFYERKELPFHPDRWEELTLNQKANFLLNHYSDFQDQITDTNNAPIERGRMIVFAQILSERLGIKLKHLDRWLDGIARSSKELTRSLCYPSLEIVELAYDHHGTSVFENPDEIRNSGLVLSHFTKIAVRRVQEDS